MLNLKTGKHTVTAKHGGVICSTFSAERAAAYQAMLLKGQRPSVRMMLQVRTNALKLVNN